jgi:hypothetical protein
MARHGAFLEPFDCGLAGFLVQMLVNRIAHHVSIRSSVMAVIAIL